MRRDEGASVNGRLDLTVTSSSSLRGRVRVPGDKSISHRCVMLGALAEGRTRVRGFLQGEDSLRTLAAFRAMGVTITGLGQDGLNISGVGLHGLQPSAEPLDVGNSGTAMRLMAGVLAGQRFPSELTGDASLRVRPMQRVMEPLVRMGARISSGPGGTAPLRIAAADRALTAIDYPLPVASAQVKSCVLLAALYAEGETCVSEPAPTRDHTERMLQAFSYPLSLGQGRTCLSGGGTLRGTEIHVPGDFSSAAFFMVGATLAEGSDLLLENTGINPTRTGALTILREMGASIELENERRSGDEPVADIRVRSATLRGITIPAELVPLAIDEFPCLFVAAACAEGETVLAGASELRVKESDRIAVMAAGLRRLGIDARPRADGMLIRGGGLSGGRVSSGGDHRIAMSFAMAGLRASGPVVIEDCRNIDTSFPGFVKLARQAGLDVRMRGPADDRDSGGG